MVINLSETSYDYSLFDEQVRVSGCVLGALFLMERSKRLTQCAVQVMEYKFPGHPAPPLGMLCKMCTSIESWLAADPENVVVVHCMVRALRFSLWCFSCFLPDYSCQTAAAVMMLGGVGAGAVFIVVRGAHHVHMSLRVVVGDRLGAVEQ